MYCFICKVSLFCTALYAKCQYYVRRSTALYTKCPYYVLLYAMRRGGKGEGNARRALGRALVLQHREGEGQNKAGAGNAMPACRGGGGLSEK